MTILRQSNLNRKILGLIFSTSILSTCSTDPAFDIVEKNPQPDSEKISQNSTEKPGLEVIEPEETQPGEPQPEASTLPEEPVVLQPPTTLPPISEPTPEPSSPPTNNKITESFEQNDRSKLDILWVIDNSGSMAEIQTLIGQNFRRFAEVMYESSVDFQMGVTTTDICSGSAEELSNESCPSYRGPRGQQGRLVELNGVSIVQSSSPTMIEDFSKLTKVGTSGSSFEHGLSATKMAVQRLNSTQSLKRPSSYLAVIVVTDEEDDGVGLSQPDERGVNYWENGLSRYRYDAEQLSTDLRTMLPDGRYSLNAIVGTKDASGELCTYTANNHRMRVLEAGDEYRRAVEATGGIFESICDNSWGTKFQRIAQNINQQLRSFKLSRPASVNSLEVLVDNEVSTDWHYDEATQSIVFHDGALPEFGASIQIRYLAVSR